MSDENDLGKGSCYRCGSRLYFNRRHANKTTCGSCEEGIPVGTNAERIRAFWIRGVQWSPYPDGKIYDYAQIYLDMGIITKEEAEEWRARDARPANSFDVSTV